MSITPIITLINSTIKIINNELVNLIFDGFCSSIKANTVQFDN